MVSSIFSGASTSLPRTGAILTLVFCLQAAFIPFLFSAEVVDEILATVDRTPILRSDLVLASLAGFGRTAHDETVPPSPDHLDPELLEKRINLEIQFRDLESSGALKSFQIDLAEECRQAAQKIGGEEKLRNALRMHDLAWEDFEALVYRMAAARIWVEKRLRPRIRIHEEDIRAAYTREVVEPLTRQGQTPPPLDEVRQQLRRILEEEQLNLAISRWLDEARHGHDVIIYASP